MQPETSVTRHLAAYVRNLRYEDIPSPVIQRTKEIVLDCLGELLAGSVYPVGRVTLRFIQDLGEPGPCTVVGSASGSSVIHAAFANATTSHCLELDDNYNPANAHVANVVVPAALAAAEKEGSNGRDLITALVAAYDVEGRIGIAISPVRLYERSFHPSSLNGNFGATVAAGKLMGLGEEQWVNALGLAGCQASGLLAWVTEPAQFSKSFQIGIASRNGVTAAQLARLGFTGPPHILEGNHNLFYAFAGQGDEEQLTQALGERFEIARTSMKKYACCRQIHAPLDGLFAIMEEQGLVGDDIDSIITRVAGSMADIIDNNELPSHNAQYVLAVAAFDRRIEVDQLNGERSRYAPIAALADRIVVEGDEALEKLFPEQWSGITIVRTRDGRQYTKEVYYPKGDPENPLTRAELGAKYMGLATQAISAERASQIARKVDCLEELQDVAELTHLLRK